MMKGTTTARAAEFTSASKKARPTGNRNVNLQSTRKPTGNPQSAKTRSMINTNLKGPFLGN